MEQEKTNNSDSSTAAESGHSNQANEGAAARSYDCAFCKRGFTNAQALGGHMNIHRKDKTKAKKKNTQDEDPLIRSFTSSFSPQIAAADYGQVLGGRHVNCQVYVPPPNPAGLQTGNYEYCFFPDWRPDNLLDRIDGNTSLMHAEDEEEEDKIDLELRLGRLL